MNRAGKIFFFGDSHIHAIQEALAVRERKGIVHRMEARRLFKAKQIKEPKESTPQTQSRLLAAFDWFRRGRRQSEFAIIGDITFRAARRAVRKLGPDDVFVSVIGGNQHAVFSTIQHPQRFDFVLPGEDEPAHASMHGAELIPFNTLYEFFRASLRDGDVQTIASLRMLTKARVVHLLTPPPKRDNSWIEQHHDTLFASEGIDRLGVSNPELRMKFWRLQNRALGELCAAVRVEVLGPPQEACDPDGFLIRDCYAGDATHANRHYGELVLKQLELATERDRSVGSGQ